MRMDEVEKLIEIYKRLEDAGLMVVAGKKDTAELMVSQDVVPVVRCKDCKNWLPIHEHIPHMECQIFCGAYEHGYPTNADDFCSYGERR